MARYRPGKRERFALKAKREHREEIVSANLSTERTPRRNDKVQAKDFVHVDKSATTKRAFEVAYPTGRGPKWRGIETERRFVKWPR